MVERAVEPAVRDERFVLVASGEREPFFQNVADRLARERQNRSLPASRRPGALALGMRDREGPSSEVQILMALGNFGFGEFLASAAVPILFLYWQVALADVPTKG